MQGLRGSRFGGFGVYRAWGSGFKRIRWSLGFWSLELRSLGFRRVRVQGFGDLSRSLRVWDVFVVSFDTLKS